MLILRCFLLLRSAGEFSSAIIQEKIRPESGMEFCKKPQRNSSLRVFLTVPSYSSDPGEKKQASHSNGTPELRCHPDSNWRIKVLQTFALPLGYGTGKKWSGRRGSDSRPPPWQGGALPTELLPHGCALGRNRTTDTVIFSHMLYQLRYQGLWRPGRGSNPRPPA